METRKDFFNRIYDGFDNSLLSVVISNVTHRTCIEFTDESYFYEQVSKDYTLESPTLWMSDDIFLDTLFEEYIK